MPTRASSSSWQSMIRSDFLDPELSRNIQRGLDRVEELLHSSIHSDLGLANETARHLVDAGGKRFRPLFALLAAQFGNFDRDEVVTAAAVTELIHLATLYHDDVMDEAALRRGSESVNARWDNTIAILTGDFLFARASQLVAELGTAAVQLMSETFSELVTGQLRETAGPPAGSDPIEHYLTVIYEKTGSLISAAGWLGAHAAGAAPDRVQAVQKFGRAFGIAFQISDDIIDITSESNESGKTPGTDLHEGVRTLPMLYALAESRPADYLTQLLAGPLTTQDQITQALELLRDSSGVPHARKTLVEYVDQAKRALEVLPNTPARGALESLADYVVVRSN